MPKKKPRRPITYEDASSSNPSKKGRRKMSLEPRTVELSKDNFNSAIESFLRATDVVKDSETPSKWEYYPHQSDPNLTTIKIHFQKEVN